MDQAVAYDLAGAFAGAVCRALVDVADARGRAVLGAAASRQRQLQVRSDGERPRRHRFLPGEQISQIVTDELTPPARERPDLGLGLLAASRRDDHFELGAGRDQLIGEPGVSERARSSASASAIIGASLASERPCACSRGMGGACGPRRDLDDLLAAPLDPDGCMPRICSSPRTSEG